MRAKEELVKRSDFENDPEVRDRVDRRIEYSINTAITVDGKPVSERDRKVVRKMLLDHFLED